MILELRTISQITKQSCAYSVTDVEYFWKDERVKKAFVSYY